MNFKTIRITLLLLVLAYIGFDTFLNDIRATDWKHSLRVVIYPINADGSELASETIANLNEEQFEDINQILEEQGKRYGKDLYQPVRISLAPELKSQPPKLPDSRNGLDAIWWSIKLRFWSWKEDNYKGIKPQVRAYALYYDPATHKVLRHSTGLRKAKISINHVFADNKHRKQNNIVILHELLHTLGASDKYDLVTGLPHYPEGFAEPKRQPLYPQKKAEIMGGQIALSDTETKMPSSLEKTLIGTKTAKEIGWIK